MYLTQNAKACTVPSFDQWKFILCREESTAGWRQVAPAIYIMYYEIYCTCLDTTSSFSYFLRMPHLYLHLQVVAFYLCCFKITNIVIAARSQPQVDDKRCPFYYSFSSWEQQGYDDRVVPLLECALRISTPSAW